MSSEYDQITAFHYAAYRPPLHTSILKDSLPSNTYRRGLDVGCGTGQSAIALTHFCQQVIGVEPSLAMLQQAVAHPKVEYQSYDGKRFNFPDHQFDIITFAGSLYYAKSQQLLDEVIRAGKNNSPVFIYDFEIILTEVLQLLGVDSANATPSAYDHFTNFEGLQQQYIKQMSRTAQSSALHIATPDITHLLLSSKKNYASLSTIFPTNDLYASVLQQLQAKFPLQHIPVPIQLYATFYHIEKS